MALNSQLFIQSGLESVFRDKDTGLPLANGTLEFYKDNERNVGKPVYRIAGTEPNYTYTPISNVITLSSVGTVQDGNDDIILYYYPYEGSPTAPTTNLELYYVVCKNSEGVPQWTREAWPNVTVETDPTEQNSSYDNQVSNPTFTNTFLNEDIDNVFTVSGTDVVYPIAPNWDLVASGTGTVTLRRYAISGNLQVATSPPYALEVGVSANINKCWLRQRMQVNPGLWASTDGQPIYLSGSFVAQHEGVGDTSLELFYNNTTGLGQVTIAQGSFSSPYSLVRGSTTSSIPSSTDPAAGADGWIDIYLQFPTSQIIRVSNIQVIPSREQGAQPVDLNSSNREQAYQGDYYIPRSITKQIDSYLVGWDFPLNPYQFNNGTATITTTDSYIADQTIAIRTNTAGMVVASSIDPISDGMKFTKTGTGGAFYLLQYLDATSARNMAENRLSVNVFGYTNNATSAVTMRVYLFQGTTFPITSSGGKLGDLNEDGTFNKTNVAWSEIPRSRLPTAQADLNKITSSAEINSGDNDYEFSGWEITDTASIDSFDKFAIVVTFSCPSDVNVTINSISCVPGDLPCRPSAKSAEVTLQECRYFYESSSKRPFANNRDKAVVEPLGFTFTESPLEFYNFTVFPRSFDVVLYSPKRKNLLVGSPPINIYSLNGTINQISIITSVANNSKTTGQDVPQATNWNAGGVRDRISFRPLDMRDSFGPYQVQVFPPSASGLTAAQMEALAAFHYEIDLRPGIVS